MRKPFLFIVGTLLFITSAALAQSNSSQPSTTTNTPSTIQAQAIPIKSQSTLTGTYQSTFSVSLLGKPRPSLGHRLTLSYAPKFGGSFDARIEYYVEGSYNEDPPGILQNNINEPKFETQLMYNRPINNRLGITGGLLYHNNFRFPDRYFWAITGLTLSVPIGQRVTFSGAALLEKKLSGVRPFYDLSGTLEYRFAPKWNTQLSYHRYENVGQFDPQPTQKAEYEIGINHTLSHNQWIGVSLFRHVQFDSPNDQFSFLKFKYGFSF